MNRWVGNAVLKIRTIPFSESILEGANAGISYGLRLLDGYRVRGLLIKWRSPALLTYWPLPPILNQRLLEGEK